MYFIYQNWIKTWEAMARIVLSAKGVSTCDNTPTYLGPMDLTKNWFSLAHGC